MRHATRSSRTTSRPGAELRGGLRVSASSTRSRLRPHRGYKRTASAPSAAACRTARALGSEPRRPRRGRPKRPQPSARCVSLRRSRGHDGPAALDSPARARPARGVEMPKVGSHSRRAASTRRAEPTRRSPSHSRGAPTKSPGRTDLNRSAPAFSEQQASAQASANDVARSRGRARAWPGHPSRPSPPWARGASGSASRGWRWGRRGPAR